MKNFMILLTLLAIATFVSCSGKNLDDLIEVPDTDETADSSETSDQNNTDQNGDTNDNPTEQTDNSDTADTTDPTDDQTTEPTVEPTDPTEPTTDPTEPTTDPTDPTTDPTEPTTDPTEPTTDPTEPTTDPTEPITDPTEPITDPTEPTTDPTEPITDPTDPTIDPTDPTTDPTEPTTDHTEPTTDPPDPFAKCTEITLSNTELSYYKHSHGSEKYDIFKATYTPNTGSATSDTFYLKFYGLSEYDYTDNFNLAEINQGSDRGLFLYVNEDEYCDSYSGDCTHGKTYFQKAGTVKVISAEFNFAVTEMNLLSAKFNGVVLEETSTNESTKACLKIKDDPTVEYHGYYY